MEVAEKANIPYQREVSLHGATNGWGISVRIGCVHLDDLEGAVRLIVNFEDLKEKL